MSELVYECFSRYTVVSFPLLCREIKALQEIEESQHVSMLNDVDM